METNAKTNEINYIIKLFRGDIPLHVTFWMYGFFIGHLASFLFENLPETNNQYIWFLYMILFNFLMMYHIFILIAIWRSANKYQGKKNLREIAKLYVVFSVFVTFSILFNAFT